MIISDSNTATKVLLMATLTASGVTYEHDMDFGIDVDYNPSKNYSYPSFKHFDTWKQNNDDYSTNTVHWDRKKLSEMNLGSEDKRFELLISQPDVIEISSYLFGNSEILTDELSEALFKTIQKSGKSKTKLPNRL